MAVGERLEDGLELLGLLLGERRSAGEAQHCTSASGDMRAVESAGDPAEHPTDIIPTASPENFKERWPD
jgi:hypothetical protein